MMEKLIAILPKNISFDENMYKMFKDLYQDLAERNKK